MSITKNVTPPFADFHHRFGAFLIDWHIRTVPIALWGFWIFFRWFPGYWNAAVHSGPGFDIAWEALSPILAAPGVAVTGWLGVIAYLLYHPVVEILMHGDSPGKRMMGIRVVSMNGAKPSRRQVLVRNAWRAIEFLPFAWAWGLFAMWRSPENARTGDARAGTRVVTSA